MQDLNNLISWLEEINKKIKNLEAEANKAVATNADAYKNLMFQKAQILASIAEEAKPLLKAVDGPTRSEAEERLEKFSAGAQSALGIGSTFYMSALLYPSKHQEGEPNNLERLIAQLKSSQ